MIALLNVMWASAYIREILDCRCNLGEWVILVGILWLEKICVSKKSKEKSHSFERICFQGFFSSWVVVLRLVADGGFSPWRYFFTIAELEQYANDGVCPHMI